MKFVLLAVAYCSGLAAQPVLFEGITVQAQTGQPLSGVRLKLFSVTFDGISASYGAVSKEDGRFSISGIPVGTYALLAERTGFVHLFTRTGGAPLPSVTLSSGEGLKGYRIEMTPRAMIRVRVVDDYGDPVPNVRVVASPAVPGAQLAASMENEVWASSNLLGVARLRTGPGKYTLQASPPAAANKAPEIRTDGSSDPAYGQTWYPKVGSADRATPVEVGPGSEIDVEIQLIRDRSLTISGMVWGMQPGTKAMVMLSAGDKPGSYTPMRLIEVNPEGRFVFAKLPARFYLVRASVASARPGLLSQGVEITPDGPETVDVALTLAAGTEVSGIVTVIGDPPGANQDKRVIALRSVDGAAGQVSGASEPDGTFRIGGVFDTRYRLTVEPMPENGYVKSIEPSSDEVVDFSRGVQGAQLKITLARDGGQISGIVREKDGRPLSSAAALLILARDAEHLEPSPDGRVTRGGQYTLKGIRPGKYMILAIDPLRSGPVNGLEDLKKLAVDAETIEIKPGERIAKDLTVIEKGGGNAK